MARSSMRQAHAQEKNKEGGRSAAKGGKKEKDTGVDEPEVSRPSEEETKSKAHTLYDLLGVTRDAAPREITAAYRRRALLCHPDKILHRKRANSEETDSPNANTTAEEATKHFQQLQAAYAILKDPIKRERYDRTGDTGEDGLEGKSYEEAYAFYRKKYSEVTKDAIDQFKERYIASEEEKEDIQEFVSKHEGDLSAFFEFIPLSDPSDVDRYKDILSSLVKERKIKETPAYKRTLKEFKSIAEKYKKRFAKEKKLADKKGTAASSKDDDMSSLTLAILGNMSKREAASNQFLEELGRKYSKKRRKE